MKKIALTGERPTGPLHIGHYFGSLQKRLELQQTCDIYIMSADVQALTDNFKNPKKIQDNAFETIIDNLSVGIDPNLSTIFIQSQVPELTELTTYYMNLATLSRLERNPTIKTELQWRGFNESIPVGFLCYPISQCSDITAFKAEIVPVGEDQLPLLEYCNEMVRKFNFTYNTNILKECKAELSNIQRLVGIDGNNKMSKSLNNAIFLKDDDDTIYSKVMSMYTDPNHIKVSDPGRVEGNVVFIYLDIFMSDKNELNSLKLQYQKGGLGDVKLKKLLTELIIEKLKPFREKRNIYSNNMDEVKKIVKNGIEKAREVASLTLREVKDAIGLNYF